MAKRKKPNIHFNRYKPNRTAVNKIRKSREKIEKNMDKIDDLTSFNPGQLRREQDGIDENEHRNNVRRDFRKAKNNWKNYPKSNWKNYS